MALPKNLQAQLDNADALLAAANAPPISETAPTALQDLAKLPDPTPDATASVPTPRTATAAVETAPAPPQAQNDPWEQKYKTLQGLFNKEVPALQHQVRELVQRDQQTATQLEALRLAQQAPAETKPPEVDSRDVESFGSDLVDMVQRVAQKQLAMFAQRLDAMEATADRRLKHVEQEVQGTSQSVAITAEQKFFETLAKLVPHWETLNASDAFLAWLGSEDPVYGAPRQSGLDAAQRSLNANRAAAVFKAFESTQPAAPAPKTNSLEKQVSPRAVATPEPTSQANAPMVTQKQITEFYGELSRGKYRGRDEEANRIEQVINQAIAEGRVR